MRHTVDTPEDLLETLQRMHPESTRNTLRNMLDTGRVRVNGARERRAKRALAPGDVVEVVPKPKAKEKTSGRLGGGVNIVYEDDEVLAVEKPAGMLTIATDRGGEDTLYDRLFEREKAERRSGRIFIVHRLDRPTSGVMLFAKNEAAKERLQKAFAAKKVERIYHVLVEGRVEEDSGTVSERLSESTSLQVYVTPSEKHGKEAITHWRVLTRGDAYSLLEVTLGTGRRHQIRVHMAHLGHPVVGDAEHGAVSDPLRRLGLHAYRLVFPHPTTGDKVRVVSKAPPTFRRALGADPEESRIRTPRRHPHRKRGTRKS